MIERGEGGEGSKGRGIWGEGRRLGEREASCLLGRREKDDRYSPT